MRSWLFIPGDDARKLDKGLASGADALIIDLEDSVALARKAEARNITAAFIRQARAAGPTQALYVRVNPLDTEFNIADLDVVMPARPDGIVLPKAQGGQAVQQLSVRLAVNEAENDLEDGSTCILAIATETARSLFHMGSFAGASHRLRGLAWGGEDLAADIGAEINRGTDGHYTDPYRLARSLCLLGAASAEVAAIDSVYTNFRDMDGLRLETEESKRDGFSGKMAIHPAQVPIINDVFTPSPTALAHARAIIAAFAANPEAGVLAIDGKMIDKPHLRQAERIVARAPKV